MPTRLLEVIDLDVGYAFNTQDAHYLIQNVSLQLHAGDLMILGGVNGSGKSTLIQTLSGFIPPLGGQLHKHTKRPGVVKLAAEPDQLWPITVREFVLPGAAHPDMSRLEQKSCRAELPALLTKLALADLAHTRIGHLSRGQWQRVLLARTLIARPDLILMDEPTANLDNASTNEFINIINQLCQTENRALLIATHDSRLRKLKFAKYYEIDAGALRSV